MGEIFRRVGRGEAPNIHGAQETGGRPGGALQQKGVAVTDAMTSLQQKGVAVTDAMTSIATEGSCSD